MTGQEYLGRAAPGEPVRDETDLLGRAIAQIVERELRTLRLEVEELKRALADSGAGAALPRLLDVHQACAQIGVGRTTFFALLDNSDLADTRVPLPGVSSLRIDRDALMRWVDRQAAGVAGRRRGPPARRRPSRCVGPRRGDS